MPAGRLRWKQKGSSKRWQAGRGASRAERRQGHESGSTVRGVKSEQLGRHAPAYHRRQRMRSLGWENCGWSGCGLLLGRIRLGRLRFWLGRLDLLDLLLRRPPAGGATGGDGGVAGCVQQLQLIHGNSTGSGSASRGCRTAAARRSPSATHSAAAPCSSSHVRMCRMLRRSMADDCLMSLLISMATAPTPTAGEQAAGDA